MKILLLIDNLNSGGAQRQIVNLAIGLKNEGLDVKLLIYAPGEHFQEELKKAGVSVINRTHPSKVKTFIDVMTTIRQQEPSVVCAFLFRPSLLALIAKVLFGITKVFVSERSFRNASKDVARPISRMLYPVCNGIIVNSISQKEFLSSRLPWIRKKLHYIPNGVDTNVFSNIKTLAPQSNPVLQIISIGHVNELKNTKILIEAARILNKEENIPIAVSWAGRNYDKINTINDYYKECNEIIDRQNLRNIWKWIGKVNDLNVIYNQADILIHPSVGEGFPNAVCEALACGCPVIVSNVCDHPYIVKEGFNGYLFNPFNAAELAEKIKQYYLLSDLKKTEIRHNCRKTAINSFSMAKMINSYSSLFSV